MGPTPSYEALVCTNTCVCTAKLYLLGRLSIISLVCLLERSTVTLLRKHEISSCLTVGGVWRSLNSKPVLPLAACARSSVITGLGQSFAVSVSKLELNPPPMFEPSLLTTAPCALMGAETDVCTQHLIQTPTGTSLGRDDLVLPSGETSLWPKHADYSI